MMSGAYIALMAMSLCRRYVIHTLSLLSSSQEIFSNKVFFPFISFRKIKVPERPCQGMAPPDTLLDLLTTLFQKLSDQNLDVDSKARNGLL